jgi:hypothetical protein
MREGGKNMLPTENERVERIRQSIDELEAAGIELLCGDEVKLRHVVREHLDFLQCMLGYDASPHEIVQLMQSQRTLPRMI